MRVVDIRCGGCKEDKRDAKEKEAEGGGGDELAYFLIWSLAGPDLAVRGQGGEINSPFRNALAPG